MQLDFNSAAYKLLLQMLVDKNLPILTLSEYFSDIYNQNQAILIRHDVDRKPHNALQIAEIEFNLNIKSSYYFRVVPESFDINIMNQISKMGHEIGYHYEDVDLIIRSSSKRLVRQEIIDSAYKSFCSNLSMFRRNFDIKTICMHGSPFSKYDNRIIWETYDYKELDIIAEPYFDLDYDNFAYFTDTGRRWNGHKFSIRDKVTSKYRFNFKTTYEIIQNSDRLPDNLIFNIHTERWDDKKSLWFKNLIIQNIKNSIKYLVVKNRLRKIK